MYEIKYKQRAFNTEARPTKKDKRSEPISAISLDPVMIIVMRIMEVAFNFSSFHNIYDAK